MASRIQILPEEVANKISAGEVVERPASVVKELVENSIDAGASRITVEIKKGGRDLIRVTDNGCGMTEEEALLSFERHSTSKITCAQDIEKINTLGFRGEALPSISAVSRMELTTRTPEAETGVTISLIGGKEKSVKKVGSPAGTSVSVEQLFFNTPARRKFLKTVHTEMAHIVNILSHEALVRRGISFELIHNGKGLLNAPANDNLLERTLYLYGDDLRDALIPFEGENDLLRVEGLLAKPENARSQKQFMVFFVNKRPVRSRLLTHAVMDGYQPLLTRGRFPVIFLFIRIKPDLIDVNVHPQKTEVKFENGNAVHDFISGLIKNSLSGGEVIPELFQGSSAGTERESRIKEAVEKYMISEHPLSQFSKGSRGSIGAGEIEAKRIGKRDSEPRRSGDSGGERILPELPGFPEKVSEPPAVPETAVSDDRKGRLYDKGAVVSGKEESISSYVPVAQVHNTYIVAETENSIILIDQHAAHERILYEQLKAEFEKGKVEVQGLLLPLTLEVSHTGAALIKENQGVFSSAGFEIEHFGEKSFVLRAVPALLKRAEPRRLFLDMIDDLLTLGRVKDPLKFREKMIIIMACRGAVKAGDRLGEDEMKVLLQNLSKTQLPHFCPHGRPTIVSLTLSELEKRFKRR